MAPAMQLGVAGACLLLLGAGGAAGAAPAVPLPALASDEACGAEGGAGCAVSALQVGSGAKRRHGYRARSPHAAAAVLAEDPPRALVDLNRTVASNAALDDNHSFWESAAKTIKHSLAEAFPEMLLYANVSDVTTDVCRDKAISDKYFNGVCTTMSEGHQQINGFAADAYYCGHPGIDWGASGPQMDLCGAEPGSAFTSKGVCGRHTTKTLVQNFFFAGPVQWLQDPMIMNIPSTDCLMGYTNCDIRYCQACQGMCHGRSQNGKYMNRYEQDAAP